MKGYLAPPFKRRWKGQAITVLALVFFSLLVPLAFLLGIHNTIPSGYFNDNDDRSSSEARFGNFDHEDDAQELSEVDHESRVGTFIRKLEPGLSKDLDENTKRQEDPSLQLETDNESNNIDVQDISQQKPTVSEPQDLDENMTRQEESNLHLETDNESKDIDVQASEQAGIVSEPQDAASQSEVFPVVQGQITLPEQLPAPNTGDLDEDMTRQEANLSSETENESNNIDVQDIPQQKSTISELQDDASQSEVQSQKTLPETLPVPNTRDLNQNMTRQEDPNLNLETDNESNNMNVDVEGTKQQKTTVSELQDAASESEAFPTVQSQATLPEQLPAPNTRNSDIDEKMDTVKVSTVEEAKKSCQLEFGSYCLWSGEHKEVMKDSVVKRLKDQLFVARSYYPGIAKLQEQEQLSRDLKQNIQDHERMLSEAISDAELPPLVINKVQKMEQTIVRAKSCNVDCTNIDKKLRQILDLTEDEAHFHMKQSAFLYHLGVQTIPKSLHCLSMRLTVEFFKSQSADADLQSHKFHDPSFRHYVIFSRSILASSVAINSTVMNSKETRNMVFHLLTDVENYYAMRMWFARNSYMKADIHVLNFDELYNMNDPYNLGSQLTLPEEFRVSIFNSEQLRTEYISVFGHSHFLLPEIFRSLKKLVILDDDVVVQQDLSSLWDLDLGGKVVGAVEFCGVKLRQLHAHLGRNNYDPDSCVWMSGLNVIDLESWRQHNVTGIYQQLCHKLQSMPDASWRAAALPASLLTLQNLVYPLDGSWALSGLGHNYGVNPAILNNAAVLHYNGNMKPWMELGIPKYKWYWKKFLTQDEHFMDDCNVNQ